MTDAKNNGTMVDKLSAMVEKLYKTKKWVNEIIKEIEKDKEFYGSLNEAKWEKREKLLKMKIEEILDKQFNKIQDNQKIRIKWMLKSLFIATTSAKWRKDDTKYARLPDFIQNEYKNLVEDENNKDGIKILWVDIILDSTNDMFKQLEILNMSLNTISSFRGDNSIVVGIYEAIRDRDKKTGSNNRQIALDIVNEWLSSNIKINDKQPSEIYNTIIDLVEYKLDEVVKNWKNKSSAIKKQFKKWLISKLDKDCIFKVIYDMDFSKYTSKDAVKEAFKKAISSTLKSNRNIYNGYISLTPNKWVRWAKNVDEITQETKKPEFVKSFLPKLLDVLLDIEVKSNITWKRRKLFSLVDISDIATDVLREMFDYVKAPSITKEDKEILKLTKVLADILAEKWIIISSSLLNGKELKSMLKNKELKSIEYDTKDDKKLELKHNNNTVWFNITKTKEINNNYKVVSIDKVVINGKTIEIESLEFVKWKWFQVAYKINWKDGKVAIPVELEDFEDYTLITQILTWKAKNENIETFIENNSYASVPEYIIFAIINKILWNPFKKQIKNMEITEDEADKEEVKTKKVSASKVNKAKDNINKKLTQDKKTKDVLWSMWGKWKTKAKAKK